MRMTLLALPLLLHACAWSDVIGDATPPEDETARVTWSASSSPDVFDTTGFGPVQAAAIEAAADEWCAASDGTACPRISEHGRSRIEAVPEVPDHPRWGGSWGSLGEGASVLMIRTDLDPWVTYIVAVHEFGHHFGCGHLTGGSVMSAWYGDIVTPYVTPVEVACARGLQ